MPQVHVRHFPKVVNSHYQWVLRWYATQLEVKRAVSRLPRFEMEFPLPALLESAAPASGGGDADVAACCQTLGGISLHSESGKQAEKREGKRG